MESNLILRALDARFTNPPSALVRPWIEASGQYDQRFRSFFDQLESALVAIASNLTGFLLKLARVSYVAMAIMGLMFWTSQYNRRTGVEMIVGLVILAIAAEAIFPTIFS